MVSRDSSGPDPPDDPELDRLIGRLASEVQPAQGPGLGPGTWPVSRAEQLRALRAGHAVCRRGAGDLLRLTGADRYDLLQRLSASDLRGARAGAVVATVFTNDKGRLVDVAMTAVADDALWVLAGRGNGARLAAWIERFVIMEDVKVERSLGHEADTWVTQHPAPPDPGTWLLVGDGWLMIREPHPWGRLVHAVGGALESPPPPVTSRRPPWHGHLMVEEIAFAQWCIEVGRLRPGPDLDGALNPLEAGLSPWVSLEKGCYIGQEVVARLANYDKVRRRPARLSFAGGVPGKGTVVTVQGQAVGFVVSATPRGDGAGNLALAVLLRELEPGAQVDLPDGEPARIEAVFGDG